MPKASYHPLPRRELRALNLSPADICRLRAARIVLITEQEMKNRRARERKAKRKVLEKT